MRLLCFLAVVSWISAAPDFNYKFKEKPLQTNATIYIQKDGSLVYTPDVVDTKGLAYAVFQDGLLSSGWGVFDVKSGYSSSSQSDQDVMFAAGFLEGALTYKHIYNQYNNIKGTFLNGYSEDVIAKLKTFLNTQQAWMEKEVFLNKENALWRNAGLIFSQYSGLVQGYSYAAPKEMALDNFAFQLLNGAGDLIDLIHVVSRESRPDFSKMTKDELKAYVQKNGHCSALIKVLGAYENIFFSHSSWFVYQATNRIFKYYSFNIEELASKEISFSSYPGFLESLDDFYLMSNGLIMLQTTNNVFNYDLYDMVTPQSLPAWVRVRVANQKSNTAKEWGSWLSQYNSGTYNNQYMVLDLNKVVLNEAIYDDALYITEQIPGYVKFGDATEKLRLGYWPSYNVPFFEEVYNRSGYPAIVESKGLDFSYQLAPRAKIFRRDAAKVIDMDTMKHIMRYNDYKVDPYSEKNACDTICCRGDLLVNGTRPDGCYDTKVADLKMAADRTAWVINGPSTSSSLPPFTWSQFPNSTHAGLPDTYDFNFVLMKPLL